MIHCLWLSYYEECPKRGYWDQGSIEALLAGDWGRIPYDVRHVYDFSEIPEGEGAIVCLPAKKHEDDAERLNADLARLSWVLLILLEDECCDFDFTKIEHPNLRVWQQTPWPGRFPDVPAWPVGHRPETRRLLSDMKAEYMAKDLKWSFAGQITHLRRESCVRYMRQLGGGELLETDAFGSGMPYEDYLRLLARSRVVPCPSGAVNPDSFRFWEALEAGAIPLPDGVSPRIDFPRGFWGHVLQEPGPFPVVEDWAQLEQHVNSDNLEKLGIQSFAWYQQEKWRHNRRLRNTLQCLRVDEKHEVADQVTVLIPTSPIADHPTTAYLDETINSIRRYPELAEAQIIVMFDGVRDEQEHLRANYNEYVRSVIWDCNHRWANVLPVVFGEFLHQVEMSRRVLEEFVRTPYILFVEHDTPLCEDIPWASMAASMGTLELIRFYHEHQIPEEHGYLHRGEIELGGHRFMRTRQWSQRPHLAGANFYRRILRDYFSPEARTFVEDRMHSVGQRGIFNMGIYLPPGDSIRRSYHTDGRKQAAKYDDRLVF